MEGIEVSEIVGMEFISIVGLRMLKTEGFVVLIGFIDGIGEWIDGSKEGLLDGFMDGSKEGFVD